MAEIINGRLVSGLIRDRLKKEISAFKMENGIVPGLAVIIVGNDPASLVYVKNKSKACYEVGINSVQIELPEDITELELISHIEKLNHNPEIHGILVQLPLPKHINSENVINSILPEKDVDAFHPVNAGRIFIGNYDFLPCTPSGVMDLLKHYNIEVSGKKCVILGRSNIVGKPMAHLLLEKNGTVTVCHSRTLNIEDEIKSADILVVAIGKPEFVKGYMIKPGAVVIDVGINRGEDGKLRGDVEYTSAFEVASYITPVPGGVGPMTITTLLKNTLKAANIQLLDK